jgi:hypothetical protein
MYPPGYIEDFFVKADAVAAPISPPAAEGTFEMGSSEKYQFFSCPAKDTRHPGRFEYKDDELL